MQNDSSYSKDTETYFAAMDVAAFVKRFGAADLFDALRSVDYNLYLECRDFFYKKASTNKVAAIERA